MTPTSGGVYGLGGGGQLSVTSVLSGGANSLVVAQAGGPAILLANNSSGYGNTSITAGTLQVDNGGAVGTLGSGTVSVASGGVLAFDRSDNFTYGNGIGGAGAVYQIGAGTLNLAGNNSFTGTAGANFGTLNLTGTLSASARLAVGGGALAYSPSPANQSQTVAGLTVNPGASTVTNNSSGTLALGAITQSIGGAATFAATSGPITTTTLNTNGILGMGLCRQRRQYPLCHEWHEHQRRHDWWLYPCYRRKRRGKCVGRHRLGRRWHGELQHHRNQCFLPRNGASPLGQYARV